MNIYKDEKNHNLHTKKGMDALRESIEKVGVIEAITVSDDGHIISGNARHEVMSDLIKEQPIVIETDGTRQIILKRTDINSNTKEFYEASILANTVPNININIDNTMIEALVEEFSIDTNEVFISDLMLNEEKKRNIIGNNYESEKDTYKGDFLYLELSKNHITKLEFIKIQKDLSNIKEAIISLIEEYDN